MISDVVRRAAASNGPIWLLGIRGEPWLWQYSAPRGASRNEEECEREEIAKTLLHLNLRA